MKNTYNFHKDTLPYLLQKRALTTANDIAYSFPEYEQHYSWSAVWREVRQLVKGFLKLGIRKGDRVALLMPNRMELILAMYAAACAGAIVVPLNTYSKKDELRSYLKEIRPAAMIIGTVGHRLHYPSLLQDIITECQLSGANCGWIPTNLFVVNDGARITAPFRAFPELYALGAAVEEQAFLDASRSVRPDDPLILLYTSGTLGSPKGILRSTASFLVSTGGRRGIGASWIPKITDRIARNFSLMNLLPLYHLGGFTAIFTNLKACNIRILMISHFNPLLALSALDKEKCSFLMGTPFMIQQMLSSPRRNQFDLSSLLGLIFTSAAVTRSVVDRVTRDLNLYFFMVSYGSSEAGTVANGVCFINQKNNLLLSLLFKLLTHTNLLSGLIYRKDIEQNGYSLAGRVDKGVEVKIAHPDTGEPLALHEHGEIMIRSHRVMRYIKENKEKSSFTEDGWYKSGDLGFLNEKRHLTITGRLNRLISRGGEKISPVEVENILLQHKDIDEALVLGIPDELYGEQVCACVVAKKEASLTAEKLKNDMTPYLSAFKLPQYFVFLPSLPLAATGKVSVAEIRMLALDRIGEMRKHA